MKTIVASVVVLLTIGGIAWAQPKPPGAPPLANPPAGSTTPLQAGALQTKSYQPIGKNKLQVDLSVANGGELERNLHDYLKQRLEARGNAVGSSGVLAVKLAVEYATPLPSINGTGNNPPPPPPGVGTGSSASQSNPIPDNKAPAFTPPTPPPAADSPMHLTMTVYREQGGAVVWIGEASCRTPFTSAKITGRAMIDQLVESIDKTRTRDADCPL